MKKEKLELHCPSCGSVYLTVFKNRNGNGGFRYTFEPKELSNELNLDSRGNSHGDFNITHICENKECGRVFHRNINLNLLFKREKERENIRRFPYAKKEQKKENTCEFKSLFCFFKYYFKMLKEKIS